MRKLIPVAFALFIVASSSKVFCQNEGFIVVESPNITLSAQLRLPSGHGQPQIVIHAGHREVAMFEKYFYLTAIDENGVPVASFGNNGELQLPDPGEDMDITSLACPDASCSKIVAGGYKNNKIALLCIDRKGKPCSSFGDQQGQVLKLINDKSARIFALESIPPANGQPGYLLAAGYCYSSPNRNYYDSCFMPFHNNGTEKFYASIWPVSPSVISSRYDEIRDISTVNDQVIVTGFANNDDLNTSKMDLLVARFSLANLTLDTTGFGPRVNESNPDSVRQGYYLIGLVENDERGMALKPLNTTDSQTGYIVVGEYTSSVEGFPKPRYLIGKINHLGEWNRTFYQNFDSSIPDGISKNSKVNSLLIYSPEDNPSDTRIYAAGELKEDIALWCVHTNGSHCADFANSGVQTFDVNNGTDSASVIGNITLTDSNEPRLLVTGYGTVNGTREGGTIRFFMDGRVDLCYRDQSLETELTLESVPENYTLIGMVNTDETANSSQPVVLVSHSPSGVELQNFTFEESGIFNLSNIEPGNYSVALYQCGRLLSRDNLSFPEKPTEPADSGASKNTGYGLLMLLGLAYALLN